MHWTNYYIFRDGPWDQETFLPDFPPLQCMKLKFTVNKRYIHKITRVCRGYITWRSGADKLQIPGGATIWARARDFPPHERIFAPPLRDSQGGNIDLGGGAKFLNRHLTPYNLHIKIISLDNIPTSSFFCLIFLHLLLFRIFPTVIQS